MFLRWVAIGALLAATSCALFSGDEVLTRAKVTHQLNGLQIALEAFLEGPPVPKVVPPVTGEANGDEMGHPVDTATEDHVVHLTETSKTTVCIVAVVDSLMLVPSADGGELDPADQDAAMRRERLVRTAVNAKLVKNTLIDIIQPVPEERVRIREGLISSNGSEMAPAAAKAAGEAIGVDHLIWAIIENDGADVNVVAQRVDNGVVVFDETLVGWDIFKAHGKSEEE